MRILALQNCEIEGFGLYEQHLVAQGNDCQMVHAYQGHPLPPFEAFDAIFAGGTPVPAYAAHEHPFLQAEIAYLGRALSAGKPCFGICCGAQILALHPDVTYPDIFDAAREALEAAGESPL